MSERSILTDPQFLAQPPTLERRAWERYRGSLDAWCRPLSAYSEVSTRAKVCNLCAGGIGLLCDCRFEPGLVLEVRLANAAKGFSRTVLARVLHTTKLGPGRGWVTGCAFACVLSSTEVATLL
jgi:hypothetical protein